MLGTIVFFLVVGLIGGAVARAILPGRDPMSIPATIVLGIVGSFVGGFLGYVITGHDLDEGAFQASGILGSIVGAVVVLAIWRMVHGRTLRHA